MPEIIGLYKSHYSLGRSILTLEKAGSSAPTYPDSIFDILKENNLKDLYLVEDGFSSFPEAYINAKEQGVSLKYGIRMVFTQDCKDLSPESLNREAKFILFARNSEGYKKLIKIYSEAATKYFYYVPRMDFTVLKEMWDDKDLLLAVPFYDSFLANNSMRMNQFIPDFSYAKPIFFLEDNSLPFDFIIRGVVDEYCKNESYERFESKTILYKFKKDFPKYLAFRCINKRSKLPKPEHDHMSSDLFCFENWKEKS